jgi:hypothetical protein
VPPKAAATAEIRTSQIPWGLGNPASTERSPPAR